MFTNKYFYLLLAFILIGIFFVWQMTAYKVAEPAYNVVKEDGNIQIRAYPSLIIAVVRMKGDRDGAINDGFRKLAAFIFGKNSGQSTIAMTAPVIQQKQGDEWKVSFIMPANYTMQTLPKPDNNEVTITEAKEKKYLVIKFSGGSSKSNLDRHENELRDYALKNKLTIKGEPVYAFYNPPWILPFLRRNEIMFEL